MKFSLHPEVRSFIYSLQKSTRSKIGRSLDLLEKNGKSLGMPHVKRITDSIYELRIRGNQEVRIFYFFHLSEIILVHGFIKKSQKIPEREIQTAEKRISSLTNI